MDGIVGLWEEFNLRIGYWSFKEDAIYGRVILQTWVTSVKLVVKGLLDYRYFSSTTGIPCQSDWIKAVGFLPKLMLDFSHSQACPQSTQHKAA